MRILKSLIFLIRPAYFLVLLLSIYGCKKYQDDQFLGEKFLRDQIKIGSFVELSSVASFGQERICVLYPYQTRVDSLAENDPVNVYLKKINYSADESHWAFVVVEKDKINVVRYSRSKNIDILGPHEIGSVDVSLLPKAFKSAGCVSIENAVIAKFELKKRIYLALGDKR